ncbi:MAG: hypothetical protein V3U73_14740 [bacterium]
MNKNKQLNERIDLPSSAETNAAKLCLTIMKTTLCPLRALRFMKLAG